MAVLFLFWLVFRYFGVKLDFFYFILEFSNGSSLLVNTPDFY